MAENKIKYGLKNVHYAKIVESNGAITYSAPKAIRGAVNLSAKANVARTPIPADDNPEYAVIEENYGYEAELEIQNTPDAAKVDILGSKIDKNGCLVENKDDVATPFALLFEFKGDAKATRHILYNCLATKPDMESSTTGDKTESKTDKIPIMCRPAADTGDIKYKTCADTPTSIYNAWYEAVTLKNEERGTIMSPDSVTFDKKTSNQADAVISIIKSGAETLTNIKNGASPLALSTNYTVSGNTATISKAYLATLAGGITKLLFIFSNGKELPLTVNVITSA